MTEQVKLKFHRCLVAKRWLGMGNLDYCCSSCHEDQEVYGDYLCEVYIGNHCFVVCCKVAEDVQKKLSSYG